jgi:hypothetical protein
MFKRFCHLSLLGFLIAITCNLSWATNTNELERYLQKIAEKCQHSYFQVPLWETGKVSESFILNKDGSTSLIKIISHPRHLKTKHTCAAADAALILAVKNASPFPNPPTTLKVPTELLLTIVGPGVGKPLKATVTLKN